MADFTIDLPGAQLDEEELKAIAADPKFIEILARNIAFYLKHGHETDPLKS